LTAATKTIELLLVEDNAGDVRLTKEALRDGNLSHNLNHVWDGEQALAFLTRQGPYKDAPRPDMILLDLNLPRMDGRQVLAAIKSDRDLGSIPVVVLTTSQAEEDIEHTYGLHANCYIVKPIDLEQFLTVVRSIEQFWFSIVKLPSGESDAA
jgi:CheY-like chemotaxis protein